MLNSQNMQYTTPKTVANKFVEQMVNVEYEEGVKKIVLDPSMMGNMAAGALPSDAMSMMQQLMTQGQQQQLPNEALQLMQQMMGAGTQANPTAGTEMIRKRPDELEKAIHQAETAKNSLDVDIENASVLGLYVNLSTKENVVSRLKTVSKVDYENNIQEAIFYYTDIGVTFFFNEDNILNEIEFTEKYRQQTSKGLKIHDDFSKAVELYGAPRMKSAKGAIWNKFSVILHDRSTEIKLIRVKIRD